MNIFFGYYWSFFLGRFFMECLLQSLFWVIIIWGRELLTVEETRKRSGIKRQNNFDWIDLLNIFSWRNVITLKYCFFVIRIFPYSDIWFSLTSHILSKDFHLVEICFFLFPNANIQLKKSELSTVKEVTFCVTATSHICNKYSDSRLNLSVF